MASDKFLHKHLGINLQGLLNALYELEAVQGLGDTAGGASPRGLYKYRIAELGLNFGNKCIHVPGFIFPDAYEAGLSYVGLCGYILNYELCIELIHAYGGRKDSAAHIGDVSHLKKSLYGAVLSKLSMKGREDNVHGHVSHRAVGIRHDDALSRSIGA